MKKLLMVATATLLLLVGCTKEKEGEASPSPNPTNTAVATNSPAGSPSASPAGNTGNTNGGAGTTTKPSPSPTTAPENLPGITKEQVSQMDLNSTYADLVKFVGKELKPYKEESGKKTYELKVSNEENKFVEVTYFNDGKMSEMKVYQR
jgi:hypothetical protein